MDNKNWNQGGTPPWENDNPDNPDNPDQETPPAHEDDTH